jgi:hypothetical protein
MGEKGLFDTLLDATLKYAVTDGEHCYVYDPYFDLKRCRVTAEVCKAMVRTGRQPETTDKMIRWLASRQNADGSWNELHPKYSRPSALATSFIGEAFLLKRARDGLCDEHEGLLKKAAGYVLKAETSPGRFRKSEQYLSDYLNVDASCGAFLARYGRDCGDGGALEAGRRAAMNCVARQWKDGVYPYTTAEGGSPEPYPLHVPCIHYQGVTIYYLLKIQEIIRDEALESSLSRAIGWLADARRSDNRLDWSKSGLMFAYYLSGAYAFAATAFRYGRREGDVMATMRQLSRNINGIAWRWENAPLVTYPFDVATTIKSSMIGDYPASHRLFRFGYGSYRQLARRRRSRKVNDGAFKALASALRLNTSTVEPSANYPDLFMTSEILDCLSTMTEAGHV